MEVKISSKNGPKFFNLNRRQAIYQRCLNCSGWLHSEVKHCPFVKCHLYEFRTGSGPQGSRARSAAIRLYCNACQNGQVGEVGKCPSSDCPLFHYRRGRLDRPVSCGMA